MFSLLERLRKKPKHTRKIIALCTSFGVTAFIFIFWISGVHIHSVSTSKTPGTAESPSPFKVIQRYTSEFVAGVGETFSGIGDLFGEMDLYEDEEGSADLIDNNEMTVDTDARDPFKRYMPVDKDVMTEEVEFEGEHVEDIFEEEIEGPEK